MQLPKIEEIRLAFLEKIVKNGIYEDSDLVVKTVSEEFPAVYYLKEQNLPYLLRTRALFSLRGKIGFIDELVVSPAERGKGQGTKIYQAIESALKKYGIDALALYEIKGRIPKKDPQEFWKRQGFNQVSRYCFEKYL